MGERALRGLYRGRKPLAFRSAKKNLFAPWTAIYPDRHSTFQTKQVVFTRRDAAQPTSKNSQRCAKRERCHAPHASHREQARRTRPSHSPEAPAKYSRTATRAQVHVNSTGARGGRRDEESGELLPPVHLQRLQVIFQWDYCCSCQARAQRRRTSSCLVKINLPSRQAACLAEVLPRRFGAAPATVLACVSQCAAVCDPYVVWPCSRE